MAVTRYDRTTLHIGPPLAYPPMDRYGEFQDLRTVVHKTLRRENRILVVGCGNSNFSAELYDDGFEEVTIGVDVGYAVYDFVVLTAMYTCCGAESPCCGINSRTAAVQQ